MRRGYFVEGLGAAQFATTGAVDRLRAQSRPLDAVRRSDDAPRRSSSPPATPRTRSGPPSPGRIDPWNPASRARRLGRRLGNRRRNCLRSRRRHQQGQGEPARGHQPGRKAGALVVLVDGELVLYVERGGKTLLTWTESTDACSGRPTRWRSPSARALWADSPSNAPTAARSSVRATRSPTRWRGRASTPRREDCDCGGEPACRPAMPEGDTVFRTAARLHQAWPATLTRPTCVGRTCPRGLPGVPTLEVVSRGRTSSSDSATA